MTANLPAVAEKRQNAAGSAHALPAIVTAAGPAATFVWDEFFSGSIRNAHTRRAYTHAVRQFLAWADGQGVELARITPGMVGQYLDQLAGRVPTKKLHLAALRGFFDALVLRHVVVLNPAASVRAERYTVVEGKTPEITIDQARVLLRLIDTSHVVGLRDRAVIAVLIYTAARIGAVAGLKRGSLAHDGTQYSLRFDEKGGKDREIPVRHDLERYLLAYLEAAGLIDAAKDTALFRSALAKPSNWAAKEPPPATSAAWSNGG